MKHIQQFIILIVFSLLSSHAIASVSSFIDSSDYRCSNGTTYDVLRHYTGSWSLLAVCGQGLLKNNSYNGSVYPIKDSHPEIVKCGEQNTPALRKCFKEFINNNGNKGGELSDIKHFDGDVGPTCGDRLSKAKEKTELIREGLKSNHEFYSQNVLDEAIREYGYAVGVCVPQKRNESRGATATQQ
jgi:hypothetical protein